MLFLIDSKNLALLLGLPLSFILASVTTIARWDAAAFARLPSVDLEQAKVDDEVNDTEDAVDALNEKTKAPVTRPVANRVSPKILLAAVIVSLMILFGGAFAAGGITGICAAGICLPSGMVCSIGLSHIFGLTDYTLMRKSDGTLVQKDQLPQGYRLISQIVGLPLVATLLLPLSLYLNLSLFPVFLLYITILSCQPAAILHKNSGRGESFKWQALKTFALVAVTILSLAVVIVTAMHSDKKDENKDSKPPPEEENVAAYIIAIAVTLQGFHFSGYIGAMVSALYRLDVRLARTPRPRPSVEGLGGRFGLARITKRSVDGVHGPPVLVPSAKEMLTTRKKCLPMPVYAAVAGGVVVLCMVVAAWAAKLALDSGLLNLKPTDWRKIDLQFFGMLLAAIFSPFPIVLSVYVLSLLRGETSFIFNSQADWSPAQDLSGLRALTEEETREMLGGGRL